MSNHLRPRIWNSNIFFHINTCINAHIRNFMELLSLYSHKQAKMSSQLHVQSCTSFWFCSGIKACREKRFDPLQKKNIILTIRNQRLLGLIWLRNVGMNNSLVKCGPSGFGLPYNFFVGKEKTYGWAGLLNYMWTFSY